MDGNSVTLALPPSRDEIERFARWILENEIRIGWTFHRGTKGADKGQLDAELPRELGVATLYLAEKLPRSNPIIPGAASSLFLVDGDTAEIVENALRIGGETFRFQTGSGKTNLVYRAPAGVELHSLRYKETEKRLEAVADGYLVAPLSVHAKTGELYVQTNDLPPTMLSADQVAELAALAGSSSPASSASSSAASSASSPLRDAATGPDRSSRHDADYDEACRLWRLYPDEDESVELVLRDLELFSKSHAKGSRSRAELRKDVRRARVYMRETGNIGADIPDPETGDSAPTGVGFARLDSFEEKAVVYFERPLWQAGTFHILAARKGAGKGTVLADLAARVTRGELGARRSVLWVASEDSSAMDILPRLAVANGDAGRVHVTRSGDWLLLPRDIPTIREAAREIGDVALVIVDPVSNHLEPKPGTTEEVQVRTAIGPLNDLADELDAVVVGIRHVTEKQRDGGFRAAILGSSAWVQTPRVVLGLIEDDSDEHVRHIAVTVGNRLPPGEGTLSFRIVGVDRSEKGHEVEIPRVEWLGASPKSLDDLLRGSGASKSSTARDAFLEELFRAPDFELPSDELDAVVVKRTGISSKTARNVRSGLREAGLVGARRDGFGGSGTWFAYLTADGIERASGSLSIDPDSGSEPHEQ